MQPFKNRFSEKDGGRYGSLQSCIRTNDIDLVGDGSHLTYFEMAGNFSFGNNDYDMSVELWHSIINDLNLPVTEIRVHPSRLDHQKLWIMRGYRVKPDFDCVWSDSTIGGNCCEVFCGSLEVGNLVNPLEHSVDVGFGWERLHQVVENRNRVDQTSLFETNLHPIVSDHARTIKILRQNGVEPGNKGRNYVCRYLIRRMIPLLVGNENFLFDDWLQTERELKERNLKSARRLWRKHQNKPPQFWWETFGVLPEEISLLC